MYASIPMIAYGVGAYNIDKLRVVILSVATLYSGFFAALIWNDITDMDIDAIAHPDRPLPSKRISKRNFFIIAVVFSILTFLFAYMVNVYCLVLVLLSALFVTVHNKYLKRWVHIPAYSEVVTPLQWVIVPIFGFLAFRNIDLLGITLFVLFTYFTDNAHDLPEGIHDKEGDQKYNVHTYATAFGEYITARISLGMLILSFVLGVILVILEYLTVIFLAPFIIIWLITFKRSYKFMKYDADTMGTEGNQLGRKIFDYFLISYDLIFLDIFTRLILYHYLGLKI
ncbi:MAG: UbiA prenyltransferase family protein [Candidatus Thermoplasmatota archaeon]